MRKHCRQLDASVEASGPHDFTVRKARALVRSAARVHRISLRVRDDRDTPLLWNETAGVIKVFLPNAEAKYFRERIWTGGIALTAHPFFLFWRDRILAAIQLLRRPRERGDP
jgi:hypothetical protein